ncbi:MAG: DNA polymerase-4, partial [Lysobacterales bacterium]|jgi:DNA polymerase-4
MTNPPIRTIAHLDMDAFFAAVEQRDNPQLIGKPVVIGADPKGGHGRGVAATCSYEARKFGIHSAMPISKAYRLCPQAVFLKGNSKKYREISKQVFEILGNFTPDVEPISIDEAFMDLSGCYRAPKTPLDLGREIRAAIKEGVNLNASIGIAPIKMAAKIASDYCKPDGLIHITDDKLLEFLWQLDIGKIWGVGKQTEGSLHALGIKTVRDIAHYPKDKLIKRFGEYGLKLHRLSNGIDDRIVEKNDEIKSVSHEHTFEVDTNDLDELHAVFSGLSEKVSRRLRKQNLKGKTISVKIRTANFKTVTRAITLADRVNFDDVILSESKKLFDQFYHPSMIIRLIGVRVSNFEDPYVQESLFSDEKSEKKEKMYNAIDKIKDKFGDKAISSGVVRK